MVVLDHIQKIAFLSLKRGLLPVCFNFLWLLLGALVTVKRFCINASILAGLFLQTVSGK